MDSGRPYFETAICLSNCSVIVNRCRQKVLEHEYLYMQLIFVFLRTILYLFIHYTATYIIIIINVSIVFRFRERKLYTILLAIDGNP